MENINRIGVAELKDRLNTYVERKKVAEQKGLIDNPKYKGVILELDCRINTLKNILLCISVLPNHLSDIDELFSSSVSIVSELFSIKAGHENEESMLHSAFEKAVHEKYVELWEETNVAMSLFDNGYNFKNKIQLEVDMIHYLAQSVLFFIAYREIICKID